MTPVPARQRVFVAVDCGDACGHEVLDHRPVLGAPLGIVLLDEPEVALQEVEKDRVLGLFLACPAG
jgi:hypothetical protein